MTAILPVKSTPPRIASSVARKSSPSMPFAPVVTGWTKFGRKGRTSSRKVSFDIQPDPSSARGAIGREVENMHGEKRQRQEREDGGGNDLRHQPQTLAFHYSLVLAIMHVSRVTQQGGNDMKHQARYILNFWQCGRPKSPKRDFGLPHCQANCHNSVLTLASQMWDNISVVWRGLPRRTARVPAANRQRLTANGQRPAPTI